MIFEDFNEKVGEELTVDLAPAPPLKLVLDRAETLPRSFGPPDARPPFALTFLGAPDPILPQGVYRLWRADGEALEIFLVPVARTETAATYRATFN